MKIIGILTKVNDRLERVSNFAIPSEKSARKTIPDTTVTLCKHISWGISVNQHTWVA